ncbi:unnamed protein product [Penicillium salamii]|uniref:Uncharacterized protein n=1 Tax=Penicillium salamii TaxID=1612424 RepID=A0A9W4JEX6_9EURO|nr:unnamed protein product [Penicillium salamii]CAG8229653.1 unnamed protein product [Penicillium salamii]CAG8375129.1 unnamed protein product [Penicillium salamii]CAG8383995.1 unnamed protein product [Penicillium salamii]CAG8386611.1 unnamed protein product [Penicillium salamii]
MRFIWFSAVLAAGCVGAPTGLKHTTRTTLNPNGDVVRFPPVSGQDLELTAQAPVGSSDPFCFWYDANNARLYELDSILLTKDKGC